MSEKGVTSKKGGQVRMKLVCWVGIQNTSMGSRFLITYRYRYRWDKYRKVDHRLHVLDPSFIFYHIKDTFNTL